MNGILNGTGMRIKGIQDQSARGNAPAEGRPGVRRSAWAGLAVLLAACLPALAAPPLPRPAQEETAGGVQLLEPLETASPIERKTTGLLFRRPDAASPAEQSALAQRLEAAQNPRRAARAYDALVCRWPYAPEAAPAQQRLAELLEARRDYRKAFDEYRYLLHYYPEQVAPDTILQRLFAIANHYRGEGRERVALTMFRQIADLAPQWRQTPQALLQAGLLQAEDKEWDAALVTFEHLTANHPGTAEAEAAAAQAAQALYRLARRYPHDEAVQTRALAAFAATLRDYPGHADREALQEEMADLLARRYNHHFNTARFYDSPRFKPETAVAAYEEFLRRFPSAPQADAVRQRLSELTGTDEE